MTISLEHKYIFHLGSFTSNDRLGGILGERVWTRSHLTNLDV